MSIDVVRKIMLESNHAKVGDEDNVLIYLKYSNARSFILQFYDRNGL